MGAKLTTAATNCSVEKIGVIETEKRKRGRPKGSKNKVKQ